MADPTEIMEGVLQRAETAAEEGTFRDNITSFVEWVEELGGPAIDPQHAMITVSGYKYWQAAQRDETEKPKKKAPAKKSVAKKAPAKKAAAKGKKAAAAKRTTKKSATKKVAAKKSASGKPAQEAEAAF